ncbi:helix-turn-helix protein [compost metagenome]
MNKLRCWLKKFRDIKGYNHDEVAKLCEISRSYYTLIENGDKTPSVKVAKKIAKTLDFDWPLFFGDKCSLKEQKIL